MVKKKNMKFIGIAIIIVILFFVMSQSGLTFFSVTGNYDSDLLTTSNSIVYKEGTNQPLTGKVVATTGVVGLSNDVAFVGSYDKENINNYVAEVSKNANYFITAKKTKMNTILQFNSDEYRLKAISTYFRDSTGGTHTSYGIGSIIQDDSEIYNSLVAAGQQIEQICKDIKGDNFAGYAWKPCAYNDPDCANTNPYRAGSSLPRSAVYCPQDPGGLGICLGLGWRPTVLFKCFGTDNVYYDYKSFKNTAIVDAQIDVQFTNASNQESSVVSLTPSSTDGFVSFGGETVGYAKLIGLSNTLNLPLDLQDEVAVQYQSTAYYVGSQSKFNIAKSSWNNLQNLAVGDWRGNWSTAYQQLQNYESSFGEAINSLNTKFDSTYNFSYDTTYNGLRIQDSFIRNADIYTEVKGDWLGLIRDVVDFDLTCGNDVSGVAGSTLQSYVTVKNVGNTSGSGVLSWNCGVSNNNGETINLGANQTTSKNIYFTSSNVVNNSCVIQLRYGNNVIKNCSIGYNFTPKPVSCGNGILDAGEQCDGALFGDNTCGTFGFDEGQLTCNAGCGIETTFCKNIIPKPEVCDDGVDNDLDGFVDKEDSDCDVVIDYGFIGLIVSIIAVVGVVIIGVMLFGGKKKKRRRR